MPGMTARVLLGHGAAGSPATMHPYVEGLGRRGIEAVALVLPKRGRTVPPAERAMPAVRDAVTDPSRTVIGGHSYGGRVASMVAAELPVSGLLLFAYPLHRPGHPEALRTEHWPRIRCPVLLLSGERDMFARIDLLREAVSLLPDAELVTFPGVGHGLHGTAHFDAALDRAAAFVRGLGD